MLYCVHVFGVYNQLFVLFVEHVEQWILLQSSLPKISKVGVALAGLQGRHGVIIITIIFYFLVLSKIQYVFSLLYSVVFVSMGF